jgi:hypothetical protein
VERGRPPAHRAWSCPTPPPNHLSSVLSTSPASSPPPIPFLSSPSGQDKQNRAKRTPAIRPNPPRPLFQNQIATIQIPFTSPGPPSTTHCCATTMNPSNITRSTTVLICPSSALLLEHLRGDIFWSRRQRGGPAGEGVSFTSL